VKPNPRYLAALAFALANSHAADSLVPTTMLSVNDPNLEVTVWASTPMLRNPTNLDFDKDGRIWVAEGVNYRSHAKRQPEGDRIMVLEDTDHDGKADKSWVFVQEPFLLAPMGVAVVDNKVIVSMAPDIIVYTDVNRDLKFDPAVDKREVLLTGFNARIHDHTIHSVTVGPDGQWYWNSGNCGAVFTDKSGKTFRIGSAYDPGQANLGWKPTEIAGQRSDDGHVWVGGFAARMNPDGSAVNIIGHNFRNSYEQTVTSFGDVFQNDNDDPPACRTAFLLEYGNAGFCSFDGKRSWGADRRPGQSIPTAEWRQEDPGTMPAGDVYGGGSPTGIAFYEDGALGKNYRGLLLSCEPGRNVVFGYFPKPDGAGFKLERFDFITSNKEGEFAGTDFKGGGNDRRDLKTMFRPSDVGVGADGAIYVADWFDARVGGHADWDDTTSGTIYRIAPKGFKPKVAKVDFTTLEGALAGLKSPAVNVRGAAQEAIRRHGEKAVKPVAKLLKDNNPYVRARAVWLLSQLHGDGLRKVFSLLESKDDNTRVVTFRALHRRATNTEPIFKQIIGTKRNYDAYMSMHSLIGDKTFGGICRTLASDDSPAVRREVALAMRDLAFEQAKDVLVSLAQSFDGQDRTYLEAWGTGATGKESQVYDATKAALGHADPLKWSEKFAWIAWRLHPAQSVADFKARALSAALDDANRKRALTAIGYNATQEAADAMLEVAAKTDKAVKAEALWWLLNRKDSSWKDFGVNAALKARGIYDPDAVELTGATIPAAEAPKFTVADVLALKGDVTRGGEKFASVCSSCHRAGDVGTEYAPSLTGWAKRQTTEVFLNSVINPSADIAQGFNGTQLKLKSGDEIHGLVLSEGDPLIVQSAGGLTQTVPRNRIAERKGLGRSLMLSADQLGLTPQDLADLNAWLKTK
jgi:putative membrane-bound dehydrogenase-like protein